MLHLDWAMGEGMKLRCGSWDGYSRSNCERVRTGVSIVLSNSSQAGFCLDTASASDMSPADSR